MFCMLHCNKNVIHLRNCHKPPLIRSVVCLIYDYQYCILEALLYVTVRITKLF